MTTNDNDVIYDIYVDTANAHHKYDHNDTRLINAEKSSGIDGLTQVMLGASWQSPQSGPVIELNNKCHTISKPPLDTYH
jgi:hypothetical protein